MTSQNNGNNNKSPANQYRDELHIFQEYKKPELSMKDGTTQTNWFDQVCGVQNLLNIEHAQACQKFKEFLNEQANKQKNDQKVEQVQQQQNNTTTLQQPIVPPLNTFTPNSFNFSQQSTNAFTESTSCFSNCEKSHHSLGYYLMCGFGIVVALKMTKRLIFGRHCHKYQTYCYQQQYSNGGNPHHHRYWFNFSKKQ